MDLKQQLKWQRSVIREEWYETMSMMELSERIQKGDEIAFEWNRRWGEEHQNMKT